MSGTIAIAVTSTLTISISVSQVVLFAASIIYQRHQQKKMQDALDKRKGFEITQRQEAGNLPVFYGFNKSGSLITDIKVRNNWNFSSPANYSNAVFDPSENQFRYDDNHRLNVSISYTQEQTNGDNWYTLLNVTYTIIWNGVTVYSKSKTLGDRWRYPSASEFERDVLSTLRSISVDGNTRYYFNDYHKISNTQYSFPVRKASFSGIEPSWFSIMKNSKSGLKNEILIMQQALCFGGINRVVDVDFDDVNHTNRKFGKYRNKTKTGESGYDVRIYHEGNVADTVAVNNGFPNSNVFTDTCYANSTFMLNRDDPAFSGIPNVSFYIEGQKIHDIEENNGSYQLSATKKFSNNSALVLLDYLTNEKYGRGLPLSRIDLKSFYESKLVCDKVVATEAGEDSKAVSGRVYGGVQLREFKLYEFNDVIDTEEEVRANTQKIVESMGQAFLIWSEGVYKLSCYYPEEQPSVTNELIDPSHVFTDEDIIREDINISWPNSENKFNQVTVKFPNAFKDFKNDDATWPESNSPVHLTFLQEDNNQPLKSEIQIPGIVDPYRAKARAEQIVRMSRNTHSIDITFSRKAIKLEPGDFFILDSEIANIDAQVYRVEKIEFDSEFNVKISAYSFNYLNLAWNIEDDAIWTGSQVIESELFPPSNLLFETTELNSTTANVTGRLSWTKTVSLNSEIQYQVDISKINPPQVENPVSDPEQIGTREQDIYDLYQEVFYRPPSQSEFELYTQTDLSAVEELRTEFYNSEEKNWVNVGNTSQTQIEIPNLTSGVYDLSVRAIESQTSTLLGGATSSPNNFSVFVSGGKSDRAILSNKSIERRDPVAIYIAPVSGLSINKNVNNSYTADSLDFDIEAYQIDELVSKKRIRINRVDDTWDTLPEDRSFDIAPNQLNTDRITIGNPIEISTDGLTATLTVNYSYNNIISIASISASIQIPNAAIFVSIETSNGNVFKNSAGDSKTLTAVVSVGGEYPDENTYLGYSYKWLYNGETVYMDNNRNILDYNGYPLTDPVIAAGIFGAEPADSTLTTNYSGSLRSINLGPEDVTNSVKLKVEVGGIE